MMIAFDAIACPICDGVGRMHYLVYDTYRRTRLDKILHRKGRQNGRVYYPRSFKRPLDLKYQSQMPNRIGSTLKSEEYDGNCTTCHGDGWVLE